MQSCQWGKNDTVKHAQTEGEYPNSASGNYGCNMKDGDKTFEDAVVRSWDMGHSFQDTLFLSINLLLRVLLKFLMEKTEKFF